ncbi:DUF1194 domain-containing protein [Agrobacterium rhizogenes]|uniref:DUF1194 domain-containing protein n=2 Tax=Rhizobium TaxID=379 RepID=UPI00026ED8A0|nr:DUF1194 domain-containing protein [Rhizobium rhizogenes]EJK79052.1 Protein of unknown function (DUF1194) [Rhizobium sp. AP16]NTF90878.1 DUF1194 domain-containing protein [Rhizobium rhizogenes]
MIWWQHISRSRGACSPAMDTRHRHPWRLGLSTLVGVLALLIPAISSFAASPDPRTVDAAIVLAVDKSSSIDPATADFQRNGHATALRSKEVLSAIEGGMTGCIAVTYVEWAGVGDLDTVLPWTKLCSRSDLEAAADAILHSSNAGLKRQGRGGTSLSFAIDISSFLLERWPGHATRKIIDISSNGTNNDGLPVEQSRDAAMKKGYVINVIAVARSEPGVTADLPGYFRQQVIGGPRSFVIVPDRIEDYAVAIRRKLVLEIAGIMPQRLGMDIRPALDRIHIAGNERPIHQSRSMLQLSATSRKY